MKKFISAFLLISFLATSTPAFAGEFKVYSADAYTELNKLSSRTSSNIIYGDAVELLVDYSSSMGCWISIAKNALSYVLPKIPERTSIALRVFGARTAGSQTFDNACKATAQISSFARENQSSITSGLNSTTIGSVTPIEFALRQTVEQDFKKIRVYDDYYRKKAKKIVLVTDGVETCGGDPCAYIRELMRTRRDISIDVIQLGNNEALACLADLTGGTHYTINGSRDKFEEAFEEVLDVPKGTISNPSNENYNRPIKKKYATKTVPPAKREVTANANRPKTKTYSTNKRLSSKYKFVDASKY